MHGLLRVRGFTQDDAHIFCTPEQIEDEVDACIDFAEAVLKTFGFAEFRVELSAHDPSKPGDFVGKQEDWDPRRIGPRPRPHPSRPHLQDHPRRSRLLRPQDRLQARRRPRPPLAALHRPVRLQPARALRARIRRRRRRARISPSWSTAPSSAPSSASSASSSSTTPEPSRCGSRPCRSAWSPSASATTTTREKVEAELEAAGLRVEADARNEKMNAKIRDFANQKMPYILVFGDKEAAARRSQRPHPRQRRPGLHAAGRLHRQSHRAGRDAVDGTLDRAIGYCDTQHTGSLFVRRAALSALASHPISAIVPCTRKLLPCMGL